ncbi:hypothetical protein BC831DRAFT_461770, partial [Entophlyctis helioformis]
MQAMRTSSRSAGSRLCCLCLPLRAGALLLAGTVALYSSASVVAILFSLHSWGDSFWSVQLKSVSLACACIAAIVSILGFAAITSGVPAAMALYTSALSLPLLLAFARSLVGPYLLIFKRGSVVNSCFAWVALNPSISPSQPDCATASLIAMCIWTVACLTDCLFHSWTCRVVQRHIQDLFSQPDRGMVYVSADAHRDDSIGKDGPDMEKDSQPLVSPQRKDSMLAGFLKKSATKSSAVRPMSIEATPILDSTFASHPDRASYASNSSNTNHDAHVGQWQPVDRQLEQRNNAAFRQSQQQQQQQQQQSYGYAPQLGLEQMQQQQLDDQYGFNQDAPRPNSHS